MILVTHEMGFARSAASKIVFMHEAGSGNRVRLMKFSITPVRPNWKLFWPQLFGHDRPIWTFPRPHWAAPTP